MKHFQIIESNKGAKLACEIPPLPCAGCAPRYDDRVHKIATEIAAGQHGHVLALCDLCAKEHLAERKILRIPGWLWKPLLLAAISVACFLASFTFCAWLIVGR